MIVYTVFNSYLKLWIVCIVSSIKSLLKRYAGFKEISLHRRCEAVVQWTLDLAVLFWALVGVIMCSWSRHFTHSASLHPGVHRWAGLSLRAVTRNTCYGWWVPVLLLLEQPDEILGVNSRARGDGGVPSPPPSPPQKKLTNFNLNIIFKHLGFYEWDENIVQTLFCKK